MRKKISIRKSWLLIFTVTVVSLLMTMKYSRSTEVKMTLNAWENVHEWRAQGQCADCHSEQEHVEQAVDFATTLPIPAAQTHTENFRRFSHGKNSQSGSHSCSSCHEASSCQACHSILPESHTVDFVEPVGTSTGSLRHTLLAKTNKESCLTCHRSFVDSCTQCHAVEEVMPWQSDAEKPLERWHDLLDLKVNELYD